MLKQPWIPKFSLMLLLPFLQLKTVQAQYRTEYGATLSSAVSVADVGGGPGNYTDFYNYTKAGLPRFHLAGYVRYKITKDFSARANLGYLMISGTDKNAGNPLVLGRNLNFTSHLAELSFQAEWNFFQLTHLPGWSLNKKQRRKRLDIKGYTITGIGLLYYIPTTEINGTLYNLRKQRNEGTFYSPLTLCFPVGLGISYAYNSHYKFSFELSYRFTTTDYLDDASNRYTEKVSGSTDELISNPNLLLPSESKTSDGKEIPSQSNYGWNHFRGTGMLRGNPKNNDGYILASASVGIILKGTNSTYKARKKGLQKRLKMGRRKTRAKF
jgi:hypothetical protein